MASPHPEVGEKLFLSVLRQTKTAGDRPIPATWKRMLPVFGYDEAPHGHAEVLFDNAALGALGSGTRLELFRLLVTCGPEGLRAGVIAERLGVQPSSLSALASSVRGRV